MILLWILSTKTKHKGNKAAKSAFIQEYIQDHYPISPVQTIAKLLLLKPVECIFLKEEHVW